MSEKEKSKAVRVAVATLVREARRAHGLTQQELAARMSITVQAVSAIENGRSLPSLTSVLSLSQVLGVPIAAALEARAGISSSLQADAATTLTAIARMDARARVVAAAMMNALAEAYPANSDSPKK